MESEEMHQCFDCPSGVQAFSTEEELILHRWDLIRLGRGKNHMKCHVCRLHHHTLEGLVRHYQLCHPAEQRLVCPGCSSVFPRLHSLIKHVEDDDCLKILGQQLEECRVRAALAAKIKTTSSGAADLGGFKMGGIKPDYGQYLGYMSTTTDCSAGLGTEAAQKTEKTKTQGARSGPPVAGATGTVDDFRRGDSKAPDLLTESGQSGPGDHRFNVWPDQDMLASAQGPVSLLAMPAAMRPAEAASPLPQVVGAASRRDQKKVMDAFNPDHPSHPHFDVRRYKNPITGRFLCPDEMCRRKGKTFKTAGSLTGHLRSDTSHVTLRVQCPSCSHFFTTVQALLQHCESQSVRCHLRDSEEYQPFLEVLTGGLAAVEGRHKDMTVAYAVQPNLPKGLLREEVYCQEE